MTAAVDTFIFFTSIELFERLGSAFEARSSPGVGKVIVQAVQGDISALVQRAHLAVGNAPLGFITSSEESALSAIAEGADEASALTGDEPEAITEYLSRLRTRAAVRRRGERREHDFLQAERLAALGTLVAGVGHELNNPLTTISLGLEVLRRQLIPQLSRLVEHPLNDGNLSHEELELLLEQFKSKATGVVGLLADLTTSTEALAVLVQDLRVFSRSNLAEESTLFPPGEVIEQALRLVRHEFGPNTIIEEDYSDGLPILHLPRNRLVQVLTNLLVNAAHAMRGLSRETHQVRVSARIDDQNIAISISDTGPGIPGEALDRIFDPFFTTKREGLGTGLGLSISQSLIQQMGGDLAVSSLYGEGASFVCILPLPAAQELEKGSGNRRSEAPLSARSHSRPSVLLIDNDEKILRVASLALRGSFKVLTARDGEEAMDLILYGTQVDAIVMELELPEVNGPKFFEWLRKHNPELSKRVVVATAAQERQPYLDFIRNSSLPVLYKPWKKEAVVDAITELLETLA